MLNKITEYGLTIPTGRVRPALSGTAPSAILPPPVSPDTGVSRDAK